MSRLTPTKLCDCIELFIDNRGKTPAKMGGDWSEKGIRVISALNVHSGYIDNEDSIRCVSYDLYKKWMSRDIKRNDCFIASEGASLGENTIWDSDEKIVLGQRLYALRTKKDVLDPWYFASYMQTKKFRSQIDQISTGSTVFGISQPVLMNVVLLLPNIDEQVKIGTLYKKIKKKIELNNKINAELESMAKTLYDYWFLQFEFPNEEGKPYKSSGGKMVWNDELKREIPEGWEVKQIGEILKESYKSRIQVNGAKGTGKYPFFTSGESILALDDYFVDGFNIFLNTGGNPDIKAFMGKCAYSTDTWCISANEHSLLLYYYLLKLTPQFEQLFFAGSGLKHLQKDMLKSKFILLPDKKTLSKFNLCCKSSWKQIANTFIQNQELASLRDFLLPMLMNGQVTFKDEVKV